MIVVSDTTPIISLLNGIMGIWSLMLSMIIVRSL